MQHCARLLMTAWLIAAPLIVAPHASAQSTGPQLPAASHVGGDGHIHVLSRAGGREVGGQIAWAGVGVLALGAVTLVVEGVVVFAQVAHAIVCLGGTVSCGPGYSSPPIELTWGAVSTVAVGAVIALVGLIVWLASPEVPPERRPISFGPDGLRF